MSPRTYQKNPKGKVNWGYKERVYCEYKERIHNFNDETCRRHVPFDRQEIGEEYKTKAVNRHKYFAEEVWMKLFQNLSQWRNVTLSAACHLQVLLPECLLENNFNSITPKHTNGTFNSDI
jgi:hypothetical protein